MQLDALDIAIRLVADELIDINPRFDAERFHTQAKYGLGRVIPDR